MFLEVTLPLARLGLVAGLALAWIKALGEFGIVLIIACYHGVPVKLWVDLKILACPPSIRCSRCSSWSPCHFPPG